MSAKACMFNRLRYLLSPILVLAGSFGLVSLAQQPDTAKKTVESKATPVSPPLYRLPDGTYLWKAPADGGGEQVLLPLQELQKIQDRSAQQQKLIDALQKPTAPSECAIRCRVEKQGEQLVAVLKLAYSFRTAVPQTLVALGGRKGFLVSASLDGNKLPILSTTDDGFAALIENTGDHSLHVVLEAPIASRNSNGKTELGFELGLPRSPITTLILEPPGPDIKRVNVATRTSDPSQPNRPAEPRRTFDVKQLSSRPGQELGHPLGPIETIELSWELAANANNPADQVQTAEIDISVLFTEAAVETTARIKIRGPAREWKVVAPQSADFTVNRASTTPEIGPAHVPVVTKPTEANKPVWKIDLPAGTTANDWVITAVVPQLRARPEDPKHRGPFPIGPFSVLDVRRQTGTIRLTAGSHTHLIFTKPSLDLRQQLVPGGPEDDVTVAFFRLTTGPTGTTLPNLPAPLLMVEAAPQPGSIQIKPTYRLTLEKAPQSDEMIWRIRAEIHVTPRHTTVETLAIEIPSEWPEGAEASLPSESAPGISLGNHEGFWSTLAARLNKGIRVPTILRLPGGQKQPFDLILTAIMRVPTGANKLAIPLLRFPNAIEQEVTVLATVPEGLEIREAEARGWDGDRAASWGIPLVPVQLQNGKSGKTSSSVKGASASALSQVLLDWSGTRPDLTAEIHAEVTLTDRQTVIFEQIKLRSAEGLPRTVRIRSTQNGLSMAGLTLRLTPSSQAELPRHLPGEFELTIRENTKELTLDLSYALPPDRKLGDHASWNIPIGLFWPSLSTQSDATVRIWSQTAVGRTITRVSPGWRELPAEPFQDRETIPLLTLMGSSSDLTLPLSLETREASDQSQVAVWVDRALIQAWEMDDGAIHFRAFFLVHKWLTSTLELRLPSQLAGANPDFFWDGRKLTDVMTTADSGGSDHLYRVRLPQEPRTGKSAILQIRYQLPAAASEIGEVKYSPPVLTNTSFSGLTRWQVTVPNGIIPLLTGGAIAEIHWRWRTTGLAPAPARSLEELDRWFRGGDEQPAGDEWAPSQGESLTARQLSPAPLTVYRFPRIGFLLFCSAMVFLLGFAISRLPIVWVGPVVAVMACLVGILAIQFPHPASHAVGACQLGLAALLAFLLIQASIRTYYRHRGTRLPGFARILAEPSASSGPLIPATRSKPSSVGSAGLVPLAPTGG